MLHGNIFPMMLCFSRKCLIILALYVVRISQTLHTNCSTELPFSLAANTVEKFSQTEEAWCCVEMDVSSESAAEGRDNTGKAVVE